MRCAGQPVRREMVIAPDRVTGDGGIQGVMAGRGSFIPGILAEALPAVTITTITTVMRVPRIREVMADGSGAETPEVEVIAEAVEMVVAVVGIESFHHVRRSHGACGEFRDRSRRVQVVAAQGRPTSWRRR
jgi:hypothetical protein